MLTDEEIHSAAWKWSWYRQSLVEAALDFAALACRIEKDEHAQQLIALEEVDQRAAGRLAEFLRASQMPMVRIHKPMQWFFRRHIERPSSVLEHLALSRVIHWRLHQRLNDAISDASESLESSTMIEPAQQSMADCRLVVDRLSAWLESFPATESESCLKWYREVDRRVAYEVRPFDEALWQLPGLGSDAFSARAV